MVYKENKDENGVFKCVILDSATVAERTHQLERQHISPVEASLIANRELCITREIQHKELEICPYCGGTAKVVGKSAFSLLGVRIKCSKCGCGTRTEFEGVPAVYAMLKPKEIYAGCEQVHYVTLEKAVENVVDLWNRRNKKGECNKWTK